MITIKKEHLIDAAVRAALWLIPYTILNEFFQPWLMTNSAFCLLWTVVWLSLLAFKVVIPVYQYVNGDAKRASDPLAHAVRQAVERDNLLEKCKKAGATVTEETEALRLAVMDDIHSCLADSGYLWMWANQSTTSRIYLYKADGAESAPATFRLDSRDRVQSVEACINNKATTFLNRAYIETCKAEAAVINAPVEAFIRQLDPNALWAWDSYDDRQILLTSELLGVKDALATLTVRASGITSMLIARQGQKPRRVYAKKQVGGQQTQMPVAPEAPQEAVSPVQVGGTAVRTSEMTSTIVKSDEAMKAQGEQREQAVEDTQKDLLAPTDVPPVPDDVLERNASQLVDFMFQELGELAMSAEQDGEDHFSISWPEGLQTLKEVEMFVTILVERSSFIKGTMDADNRTITLYIPMSADD